MRSAAFFILISLSLFLTACSTGPDGTTDSEEIGEYMSIQNDVYANRKLGPAKFTHDTHMDDYGIDCTECHHEYVDGENVFTGDEDPKPCITCHKPGKPQGNVYKLSTAYHKQCRTCHKEYNDGEGMESAPMSCYRCHERQLKQ